MADIADIMDALEQIVLKATHPNGTQAASVIGKDRVVVGQGWPLAADLDRIVKTRPQRVMVSIYAVPSSTSDAGQPFLTEDKTLAPAVKGISLVEADGGITLTGAPEVGEYVTVEVGGQAAYTATALAGSTAASLAEALRAQIRADFPAVDGTGSTITLLPGPFLSGRVGAPVTMVRRIHRQRTQFRVCIWAATPADRAGVARAVDVGLKQALKFVVPIDQTEAVMTAMGTNLDDKFENEGIYRRDLIVNVTYDTTETYQAYEVTSVRLTTTPDFARR